MSVVAPALHLLYLLFNFRLFRIFRGTFVFFPSLFEEGNCQLSLKNKQADKNLCYTFFFSEGSV
jgi:hypothetical protein